MGETGKQFGDQPPHWIWGFATGASQVGGAWIGALAGAWWVGLLAGQVVANASRALWTLREGKQREGKKQPDGTYRGTGSHWKWDPYLDTAWFVFGDASGTVLVAIAYWRFGG